MAFGDYQLDIYLRDIDGIVPSLPMAFAEWEARACRRARCHLHVLRSLLAEADLIMAVDGYRNP